METVTTLLKQEFIETDLLLVFIVLYAGDKDEEHGVEGLFALYIWKQSFSVKHVLIFPQTYLFQMPFFSYFLLSHVFLKIQLPSNVLYEQNK